MKKSITELLVQLKTITNRINKKTTETVFSTYFTGTNPPKGYKDKESFEKQAKESLQSIEDLIEQKNKIKDAIVKSNAETIVTIANKEYTVASAIEMKKNVGFIKSLANKIIRDFQTVTNQVEQGNNLAQQRLDKQLETLYGKETKTDVEGSKSITEEFWKKNKVNSLDPIDSVNKAKALLEEIESFESSVDIILTVSNSRTEVEI